MAYKFEIFFLYSFNSTTRHLLTVAYELVNREAFSKIANAHLNRRRENQDYFKAE